MQKFTNSILMIFCTKNYAIAINYNTMKIIIKIIIIFHGVKITKYLFIKIFKYSNKKQTKDD